MSSVFTLMTQVDVGFAPCLLVGSVSRNIAPRLSKLMSNRTIKYENSVLLQEALEPHYIH